MRYRHSNKNSGQAAFIVILFFILTATVIALAMGNVGLSEARATRELIIAKQSIISADAAVEDVIFRILKGGLSAGPATVALNGAVVNVYITNPYLGDAALYQLDVNSKLFSRERNNLIEVHLSPSGPGSVFAYALQVGYLGLDMNDQSKVDAISEGVSGNVHSNGTINGNGVDINEVITGVATVADGIGNQVHQSQGSLTNIVLIGRDSNQKFGAQRITSDITAESSKAELFIGKVGNPSCNFRIRVFGDKDYNGEPRPDGGDNIASGRIDRNSVPALNETEVNTAIGGGDSQPVIDDMMWLPTTINWTSNPVVEDEKYWIVADMCGNANSDNYYVLGAGPQFSYRSSDPDPKKMYKFYVNKKFPSISTWVEQSSDMAFKIYLGEVKTAFECVETVGSLGNDNPLVTNIYASYVKACDLRKVTVYGAVEYYQLESPFTGEVRADGGNILCTQFGYDPYCLQQSSLLSIAPEDFPYTMEDIGQWKQYTITSPGTVYPGNQKIEIKGRKSLPQGQYQGDVEIEDNGKLCINGDPSGDDSDETFCKTSFSGTYIIWIEGDFKMKNNCKIWMPEDATDAEAIIIVDGKIDINNNCEFDGIPREPKESNTHILLVAAGPQTGVAGNAAINISNSASGDVVVFAPRGRIVISNSVTVTAAAAAGVTLNNSATIIYKEGVLNPLPYGTVGADPEFQKWREIE